MNVLRLGIYELLFDDLIPDFAAMHSSVDLAKKVINKKTKFSRSRSIVTDGFTLDEWRDYVLGGKVPPAISDGLSTDKITELLNGVLRSAQRVIGLPKIKYTGDSSHTLEKMRLTGLNPNVYYSQTEWYVSLSKVRLIERKQKPYNIEAQKKYKIVFNIFVLFLTICFPRKLRFFILN